MVLLGVAVSHPVGSFTLALGRPAMSYRIFSGGRVSKLGRIIEGLVPQGWIPRYESGLKGIDVMWSLRQFVSVWGLTKPMSGGKRRRNVSSLTDVLSAQVYHPLRSSEVV